MTQYHEPVEELGPGDRDIVRALASLKEEVEAIDWYHQRASTTHDADLKKLLIHNRDEEVEHAVMALEWLRKRMPAFDAMLREFLFLESVPSDTESMPSDPAEKTDPAEGHGLNIGQLE